MTSTMTLLLSCLLMASQGSADMDNNQQTEQMISNMMAAKMAEVEERLVTKLRGEMAEKDKQMEEMREEMEKKDKQMKEVKTQLNSLEAMFKEVDQKSLRDLPYVLTCAHQDAWTTPNATITYDRLTVDYNNSDRPGGGDGDMNISTGVYTALTAGHHTVTYSGWARLFPGEQVNFWLSHNDQYAGFEGEWQSYSSSNNGGFIDEQGSRTVVSV